MEYCRLISGKSVSCELESLQFDLEYDIAVVGLGTVGVMAAIKAASLGAYASEPGMLEFNEADLEMPLSAFHSYCQKGGFHSADYLVDSFLTHVGLIP